MSPNEQDFCLTTNRSHKLGILRSQTELCDNTGFRAVQPLTLINHKHIDGGASHFEFEGPLQSLTIVFSRMLHLASQMSLLLSAFGRCLQNSHQRDIHTILLLSLISIVPIFLSTIISKIFPRTMVSHFDKHGVIYDGISEAPDYIEVLDLYQDLAADD